MIQPKYLIIDIIPLIRLPTNAPDYFSYFSRKKIKKGAIVQVEFRQRKIYGYVYRLNPIEKRRAYLKEEKLTLKPVLKIINEKPLITEKQIILAHWLKNYANLSLATALLHFFPYKKLIFQKINFENKKREGSFSINYQTSFTKNELFDKKTLIIVPQENYLKYLAEKFALQNIISSKISEKKFLNLIAKIIGANKEIFLATKNGIFLPWQFLDQIIIYEEGSIFYKEFFKEPYFDYRKIFLKFAEIHKIKYLAIGGFPSFSLMKDLNLKPKIKINFQRINFNEFEEKIKEFKKTIIFVPQKSFSQRLICQNCYFVLKCSLCENPLTLSENLLYCHFCLKKYNFPEICPHCQQKTSFISVQKGAEAIYNYLLKIKRKALFLKKDDQKIIDLFKNSEEGYLVGSLYLLNPELQAEAFFFFNFSQFYFSSDLFLKERFLRILEFFSSRVNNIFLLSEILNPQIENKIRNGEIIEDFLKEREIYKLPPFKRLVILKEGSVNLQKIQNKLMEIKNVLKRKEPQLEVIGPIFSRPLKIKKRFFLELVLKIDENLNFNLKKLLENMEVEKIEIDAQSF